MAAVDQASSVMIKESETHKSSGFNVLHHGATPVTDHPLKNNDAPDFGELAKYVMMPEGVALAAFSRPIKKEEDLEDKECTAAGEEATIDLDCLDRELAGLKVFKETVPFPKSPRELRKEWVAAGIPWPREDSPSPVDEDTSLYQAVLSPGLKDVRLLKDASKQIPGSAGSSGSGKRRVPLTPELRKWIAPDSETNTETTLTEQMHTAQDNMSDTDTELDDIASLDDLEDSILETLAEDEDASTATTPIPVLTASEERIETRNNRTVVLMGEERQLDMKVIEPYKRVLSHGGYLSAGSRNAIIIFNACYLPDRSRKDYSYVMDNLFLYIIMTLDQLITEDYVLVFLQGATKTSVTPNFSWLKRCYELIDRRLRKNLRTLYLVHASPWLRFLVAITKRFVSSKFSKKLQYVDSLADLRRILPLEQASIPDKVKKYDALKQDMLQRRNSRRTKV